MNIPESKALKTILKPASIVYGLGASVKLGLYSKNILSPTKSNAPVISIGNITVGGTGKTPITIDLANRLQKKNLKVGILSRGYKRKSTESNTIVSDGNSILATCEESGDEPYLMALACPDSIVISGQNRIESAKIAIEKFNCQIILLDDGFQHVKLKRDNDIVLLDYNDKLWEESILPAGRLREPLSGLNRATTFVITKVPVNFDELHVEKIKKTVRRFTKNPVFYNTRFIPSKLRSNFEELDLTVLEGKKVAMVCAIARPESFKSTLLELGCEIAIELVFSDHHWYDKSDQDQIAKTLEDESIDFVVTTEKDLVRLNLPEKTSRRTFAITQKTEWLGTIPDVSKNLIA